MNIVSANECCLSFITKLGSKCFWTRLHNHSYLQNYSAVSCIMFKIWLTLHPCLKFWIFSIIQSKVMTQSYGILLFGTPCITLPDAVRYCTNLIFKPINNVDLVINNLVCNGVIVFPQHFASVDILLAHFLRYLIRNIKPKNDHPAASWLCLALGLYSFMSNSQVTTLNP